MSRTTPTRPRLIDVARLAGVSLGSASRALNVPQAVKGKTRKAVQEAAKQLAYVPDGRARSLALRRSFTVGAVLPTINNPVYADFAHALQQGLSGEGYSVVCSAHAYDRVAEALIVERLLQRGVDGIVLVGTDHDANVLAQIVRAMVPYLFTWSTDEIGDGECVGFSNRRAMQQLTQHLISLGHRRISVLSGETRHNERARARLAGITDGLNMAGHQLPPKNIICGPFTVEAGRAGLRRALALTPRPTALMCATDLLAAGALAEARELKIKVPRELSITGFDDIDVATLLTPPLTTVRVPTFEIGLKASEAILRAIAGRSMAAEQVSTELIVRESTGPAPTKR